MNTVPDRWRLHQISYADLEFDKWREVMVARPSGVIAKTWVPVGMPKITRPLLDTVFFLYERNPKTGKVEGPFGTGSIVARPWATVEGFWHYYGVSNWHVANDGASILRINTKDGATRPIDKDPALDWHFMPNSDDVSVCDLTDDLSAATDAVSCIPEYGFATKNFIASEAFEIGIGDDLIMLGLFADQEAGERNIPSGRFGNISMLANEKAPIKLENGCSRPSHLGDMRSRAGYSGSPVFVYRTTASDLRWAHTSSTVIAGTPFLNFLGVHCGQYWDPVRFKKASKEEAHGDAIHEGDEMLAQGAITIIAPAWTISQTLDREPFVTMRKEREKSGVRPPKLPRADLTRAY